MTTAPDPVRGHCVWIALEPHPSAVVTRSSRLVTLPDVPSNTS